MNLKTKLESKEATNIFKNNYVTTHCRFVELTGIYKDDLSETLPKLRSISIYLSFLMLRLCVH